MANYPQKFLRYSSAENRKKVVVIFVIVFYANLLSAQQTGTYTQMFDSLLFHIGKSDATTGILYDRVIPFAYLMRFNDKIIIKNIF